MNEARLKRLDAIIASYEKMLKSLEEKNDPKRESLKNFTRQHIEDLKDYRKWRTAPWEERQKMDEE